MLLQKVRNLRDSLLEGFNGHPPLGVNATWEWASNTNRAFRVYELPPSFRFPPLREGNRAGVRFPLLAGGTLRRGSSIALVFVNCVPAIGIQWGHPPLGVNATRFVPSAAWRSDARFNGHPPLGVNATYAAGRPMIGATWKVRMFQWAPTLGGECYLRRTPVWLPASVISFNGHPPLGVNATNYERSA
jgi:hypothetical protein